MGCSRGGYLFYVFLAGLVAEAAPPIPTASGVVVSAGATTAHPMTSFSSDLQGVVPEIGLAFGTRFYPQGDVSYFNMVEAGIVYDHGRGAGLRIMAGNGYPQLYMAYGVQTLDGSLGGHQGTVTMQALTSLRVGLKPVQVALTYALGVESTSDLYRQEYGLATGLGASIVIAGLGPPKY